MKIDNEKIIFHDSDMKFVRQSGIKEALQTVIDFRAANPKLPFLYDTDQLSYFFVGNSKRLFDLFRNCEQHYYTVELKKKNGKSRLLHVPDEELKRAQRMILHKILKCFTASDHATAYVRRKSLTDNANPHVGKRYLLKLDITDFFGSITFDHVYRAVFNSKYFPKQIGVILTSLCCCNDVLPQGAPTSPYISNIVMCEFDDCLGSWCKKHGVAYTRYCDDLTFSSNQPLFHVYQKVRSMLECMGFAINESKTHFVTNANRQSVTGLTVNEKVSVSAEYKRKLRQAVHYVLRYGSDDCILHTNKTEFITNGVPDEEKYLQHLIGRVNYVLQIEPNNTWFGKKIRPLNIILKIIKFKKENEK